MEARLDARDRKIGRGLQAEGRTRIVAGILLVEICDYLLNGHHSLPGRLGFFVQ